MQIKKAVIPCGGRGTRFLTATKAIPKEILPVIDTPVLAYIVKEIIESGINEIFIILGPGKEAIKKYFTPDKELERAVADKPELFKLLQDINMNADIRFGVQNEPRGSGDAIMQARKFTGDEPFCMSNGDDLIVSDIPATLQLSEAYDRNQALIVGVQEVAAEETDKYGIIVPTRTDGKTVWCEGIIEKPRTDPPSRLAALGRYVLTPDVYGYIENTKAVQGEIRLTDAICDMMRDGKVYAYEFDGKRYDMGDKFGALTATVDFALRRPELGAKFRKYLENILKNED